MVPLVSFNSFEVREFLLKKIISDCSDDKLKCGFINFLGIHHFDIDEADSCIIYLRCAIAGLTDIQCNGSDLHRVLGQSPFTDGVPMPWVSDVWAVFSIGLAVKKFDDTQLTNEYTTWVNSFLPTLLNDQRLTSFEKSIAEFILGKETSIENNPTIYLFLYYKRLLNLVNDEAKNRNVQLFISEFKNSYINPPPTLIKAIFVYVFDEIVKETSSVPPNHWGKNDIITFLENIKIGLRKWTWEDAPKTKNSSPIKWQIENEYHVQNLLYVLLSPIFPDIQDEVFTTQIGQKTPRIDLHLPSINLIIEVKYRKDTRKSFQSLIGEIAEDVSLYRADPKFKKSIFICVLWDATMSTQEHVKFNEGVMKIDGMDGVVTINAPSQMQNL